MTSFKNVKFDNGFAISNYLRVDPLMEDEYFFGLDDPESFLVDTPMSFVIPTSSVPDDSGYDFNIKAIREAIKFQGPMSQCAVNTFHQLCREFQVDLNSNSWQGQLLFKMDNCPSRLEKLMASLRIKDLNETEEICEKKDSPVWSYDTPECSDGEEEEVVCVDQSSYCEDVQFDDFVPVEEVAEKPLTMGFVTSLPVGPRAFGDYYFSPDRGEKWNDQILNDYLLWLKDKKYDVPVDVYGYDDPLVAAKWVTWTDCVSKELARLVPFGHEFYIPGDGLGIFSLNFKRFGHKVYSSEPAGVGLLALKLGLIDSNRPYTDRYDDNYTVLISANLPPEIEINWRGPVVLWQQSQDRKIGDLIPDTGGRLWIKDLGIYPTRVLRGPSDRFIENVRKRILQLARKKKVLSDKVFVTDKSMIDAVERAGFAAIVCDSPPPDVLVVGRGEDEFDIHTNQDHKSFNKDFVFYCNIGDRLFVHGIEFKVRQFGDLVMTTPKGFVRVRIKRRENLVMVVYEEDDGLYVNSIVDKRSEFEAIFKNRIVYVNPVESSPELAGFKIKVTLQSFRQRPLLRDVKI